jgi:hypothetical protein
MPDDVDQLRELNIEIARAETRGDAAFFEELLAPAFAMRRADGKRLDDRAAFLAGVAESAERRTQVDSISFLGDCRALVECVVALDTPEGERRFHNVRVFVRESPQSPWKLLAWANEPSAPPA